MRIVWYGHSAFRLEFGDRVVLIDPFLTGNPAFSGDPVQASAGATHVLLTHGHGDHVGDTVAIAKRTGATVVGNYELCLWLQAKGVERIDPMNVGGTLDQGGFRVTMVRADHSSTDMTDGVFTPLGNPAGLILRAPGEPVIYHMGDTGVFADMALIQEMYRPDVVMVPIGDRFTMGAEGASFAIRRFFRPKAVMPCHYGTFPIIDATADAFLAAMEGSGIQVVVPHIGLGTTVAA